MRLRFLFGLIVLSFVVGTASAAQVASFVEINGTNDWGFFNVGGTNTTDLVTGNSQIRFFFANTIPGGNPAPGEQDATLVWSMSSNTPGTVLGGNWTQNGFSGSFSILRNSDNKNLLSGTFGAGGATGQLSGTQPGNSANGQDSTPPIIEVVFTSDFLTFAGVLDEAWALAFTNVGPPPGSTISLNGAGFFTDNATGAGTGTFSADPLPRQQAPEPATMLMLGSALIGLGLIGRKRFAR